MAQENDEFHLDLAAANLVHAPEADGTDVPNPTPLISNGSQGVRQGILEKINDSTEAMHVSVLPKTYMC